MFSRLSTRLFKKSMMPLSRKMPMMTTATMRPFFSELGLESKVVEHAKGGKADDAVELWREHEEENKGLTLKTDDQISNYVLNISKEYFRTTKKAKLGLESSYKDHGLDSLDIIELIIQVEDDLGYVIDAENLEKFSKPKHFVNFIKQIEAYKSEFNKLPTDGIKAKFNIKAAFPTGKCEHH